MTHLQFDNQLLEVVDCQKNKHFEDIILIVAQILTWKKNN